MNEWLVCPHPRRGWRVLTPLRTQAAIASSRRAAIEKAEDIIAGEGGGHFAVLDSEEGFPEHREVPCAVYTQGARVLKAVASTPVGGY